MSLSRIDRRRAPAQSAPTRAQAPMAAPNHQLPSLASDVSAPPCMCTRASAWSSTSARVMGVDGVLFSVAGQRIGASSAASSSVVQLSIRLAAVRASTKKRVLVLPESSTVVSVKPLRSRRRSISALTARLLQAPSAAAWTPCDARIAFTGSTISAGPSTVAAGGQGGSDAADRALSPTAMHRATAGNKARFGARLTAGRCGERCRPGRVPQAAPDKAGAAR